MSFAIHLPADRAHTAIESQYMHQLTHDFDEQAQLLRGWNQGYDQISAGAFEGFISQLHLNDLSLFLEFTNQTLHQDGFLAEDTVAIGVPFTSIENGMFCGSPCQKNSIHIYSGRNGFEFISPQNLLIGLIVISKNRLMRLLSAEDQYFLNLHCKEARIAQISADIYTNLVQFLHSTFEMLKLNPDMMHHAGFQDEVTANAIQVVIDSLLVGHQQYPDLLLHKSWKVVADTREIVNLRQDNPISVSELCESLEISRRTLQYHFQQALSTSPIAYLRAERLNGVRRMLKSANSVTEAATHWGFWHFGHFSHEYKKMFGELPSDTFRRLHH